MNSRERNAVGSSTSTSDQTEPPWAILFFRSRLTLSLASGDLGRTFVTEGQVFRDMGDGLLSGFFDRVVDRDRRLVGFQIFPLRIEARITMALSHLSYVVPTQNGKALRVRLRKSEIEQLIPDQAFGGRIYRADFGEFAISLDTFFLTEADRDSLRAADADWIEIAE